MDVYHLLEEGLYDKIGSRILIPTGFAIITVALFILSTVGTETGLLKIVITYAIVCIGIGCTLSISQTSALNILPKQYYPHGVAILNTLQQVAAAIGSAVFIGIMSSSQSKVLATLGSVEGSVAYGFRTAVLALNLFAFIGLCLSIIMSIKNKKK